MKCPLITEIEEQQIIERPDFAVGDTVEVHCKIVEGNKERVQTFTGHVIAMKGSGVARTFTVRRTSHGVGVERVFPYNSPRVLKIVCIRRGVVRRSKLYYLRKVAGKKARIKERIVTKKSS